MSEAKSRRWKARLQNAALAVGTFLLCIIVLEVFLRLKGYGNLEIYEPDPKLYWKLKPNQDCYTKIDHRPVHINSHGTRGPDFETVKPPGTIRVLSLGDSRTFGWGLKQEETYSDQLRRLLQEQLGGAKKIEVINAGVNAWSYSQMLVYFRDTALHYQPDVVVLAEANLWTQFSEWNSAEFVKKFIWRVRLKNFLRRFAIYHYLVEVKLKDVYERQRTKFVPVDPTRDALFKEQQQQDPNAAFRAAIQELCRLAQSNGVKPVLLYLPMADDLNATKAPAILKIKQEVHNMMNMPLVDLTPDLRAEGKTLYLEADPVHLNARGNEIVGRRLFETVQDLIKP
jgi:lysophospholipase L1-like esterase